MKYQSTKTLFTILLFLLIVTEGHGATQHQPSNMQTRKIDIYTSSVTNINAGLYSFPYENALTLSSSRGYNPIGMISMSKLDLTPFQNEGFWCSSQSISTISITISCTIRSSTSINKLSYYYLVTSSDQYMYTYYGSTYSYLLIEQISLGVADVTGYYTDGGSFCSRNHTIQGGGYLRGFLFLRGIQHVLAMSTFYLNPKLTIFPNTYQISLIFSQISLSLSSTSITKVYLSVIIFDSSYFDITKKFNIIDSLSIYQMGNLMTNIPSQINISQYWMIIGAKSISFQDNQPLYFQLNYETTDIPFPTTSAYNQIQYIWITQLSQNPTQTTLQKQQQNTKKLDSLTSQIKSLKQNIEQINKNVKTVNNVVLPVVLDIFILFIVVSLLVFKFYKNYTMNSNQKSGIKQLARTNPQIILQTQQNISLDQNEVPHEKLPSNKEIKRQSDKIKSIKQCSVTAKQQNKPEQLDRSQSKILKKKIKKSVTLKIIGEDEVFKNQNQENLQ